MRKVLLVLFLMASASSLYGQTATPTPTATNTPTPTPTITPVLIDSTLPAYVLVANGTTDDSVAQAEPAKVVWDPKVFETFALSSHTK